MCRNLVTVLGLPSFRRDQPCWPCALLLLAACLGGAGQPRAWAANPFKKSTPAAAPSATQATASDTAGKAPAGKAPAAKGGGGKPTVIEPKKADLIAVINGERVTRDDLAKECVKRYGTEVLDNMVHKQMIADYCRSHDVTVTNEEVEEEIDRMANKFKIPKREWLKLLEKERQISRSQYTEDIIWPSLALRKLAAPELTVTPDEIEKAYESQFGPAAKVRLIVMGSAEKAKAVRVQAAASPDDFPALARKNSEDAASASAGGLIPPIRHHLGDPQLEEMAFKMKIGSISPVMTVQKQYVIMKCEDRQPGTKMERSLVDPVLIDALKEGKIHAASLEVFKRIETETVVDTIHGNAEKQKKMPGVAASVGGRQITIRELSECCIDRHGIEVLDKVLDHKMLAQALKSHKMTVDQADLDAEVGRAAVSMGQVKANGKPDVEAWLEQVTKQQHVDVETYMTDAVWPSVALKKLVGDNVPITEEDLKKGFEANYGPRCQCRAIILANQRKAQEVWEKARDNPTLEHFAVLARQYSNDSSSGSLGGQIPPIQMHGGQPLLEKEAFALKPNDLSSVVQVGENFIILFCEGYTKPIKIDMAEARKYIEEDLREKKTRIAMHKEYAHLTEVCTVDNYLAGTMKSPRAEKAKREAKDAALDLPPSMTEMQAAPGRGSSRR
ncbi:MAG TPA: peptidylprolyl isomerase [Pirellulales bacterium]|jgi:parvulin-like peptidyl-prolyl isomerase|nr:peptidylprolyl isomerase [Pirellulales bacterium]